MWAVKIGYERWPGGFLETFYCNLQKRNGGLFISPSVLPTSQKRMEFHVSGRGEFESIVDPSSELISVSEATVRLDAAVRAATVGEG